MLHLSKVVVNYIDTVISLIPKAVGIYASNTRTFLRAYICVFVQPKLIMFNLQT